MRQHFEGKRTRPLPLVGFTDKCSFKTFQWNVLNVLYFHHYTKATACAVVKDALSCRASLFCNTVAKFTLAERLKHACGRSEYFALLLKTNKFVCDLWALPPRPLPKGAKHPLESRCLVVATVRWVSMLFLAEHILAYSAEWTFEIFRQIFKLCARSNTKFRCSSLFVVNPAACVTYIFFHNDFLLKFILLIY